jgi:hemerythrin-like domain-containing protein
MTTTVPQVCLPGQAHVADGPYDQTGMYLMHHAFRRDLDHFVRAVRATPVGDVATWKALAARWDRFAVVLHHHHEVEDASIWPVLVERARTSGAVDDEQVLLAMEAEHDGIDPALEAVRAAFAKLSEHPCDDHRNALDVRMTSARGLLEAHLAHEETEALPILQRTMTVAEFAASEKAAGKAYPLSSVPFLVPWVLDGLPGTQGYEFIAAQGRAYAVLHRLTRRRFERGERAAFRYA